MRSSRPASAGGQDLEEIMKAPPISVLLSVNEIDNKNQSARQCRGPASAACGHEKKKTAYHICVWVGMHLYVCM